jgi:DNA primase
MRLPAHEDPDEFVRRDPQGWAAAVERAQPLIDFVIEAQTADLALETPQGKLEATRRVLPIIAEVRDRTLSEAYVGILAAKVRLDQVELRRDLAQVRQRLDRQARTRPARRGSEERSDEDQTGATVERLGDKYPASGGPESGPSYSASGAASGLESAGAGGRLLAAQAQEEECLGLLIERPVVWAEVHGILADGDFASAETRAVFAAISSAATADPSLGSQDPQGFVDALPPYLHGVARRARERVATAALPEGPALAKYTAASAYRLKRTRLNEELAELDFLQRDAEQSEDAEGLRALRRRKLSVLSQRRALDAASGLQG